MSIGLAVSRVEGRAKVTGGAKYSSDQTPPGTLHAVLAGAPVAAGRVLEVNATAALALPGVVRVLTRADMPKFGKVTPPAMVLRLPMQSDEILHEGEPVAIVLGESIEAAEAGRAALEIRCEAADPVLPGHGTVEPAPGGPLGADMSRGDVERGLAQATHRLAETYVQPPRHHNPMETSCTIAQFDGGALTLWDSVQAAATVPPVVAAALGIPADRIRIIAPHTGGGFGGKGYITPHEILAAAAARIVGRPVKLHLRRVDQFTGTGYQPCMTQDVALGIDERGRLTAVRHHILNDSGIADTHFEPSTEASKGVYATPALETRQTIERISSNVPSPMRAPVDGPGLWALESAMNEIALMAGMDPLDIRLANYAEVHPENGKPWSSKKLREAYQEGAELYGWRGRRERPRQDGPWRIGHGMATCSMGTFRMPGNARVRLLADGSVIVETNVQDIGTGTQTILAQIAATELSVPIEQVTVRWGDSNLPATGPVYGSSTTMHTGGAVALACRDLCEKLRRRSSGDALAALHASGLAEESGDGHTTLPGNVPMDADGGEDPHAMRTFGAVFLEVGVDPALGLVRLRRAVGAYSAGRIINPKTARSQMTGAMIFGWGKATMEESVREPATGRWLAKNLSNVVIPVNADIPSDITIHFVDEVDAHASVLGAKGIGELGATGVDAAVAAAVYDAVGVRIRELPITPRKILEAAPLTQARPQSAKR